MANVLFVVWRESVEAMLVIGILFAWLRRQDDYPRGVRALWCGIGAGVALAAALGWAMVSAQDELSGEALEWFQVAILLGAAALIVQMVLWMRKNGRGMQQRLEQDLSQAVQRNGARGVAIVAALAVAREGAETVVFLYGMGLDQHADGSLAGAAVLGFALAGLTAWAVSRGLRFLQYRHFFRISGALLLLFACALLGAGIDRLIGMGTLPALVDPLWDSSALFDDGSGPGALLAAFTGYRARPSLMLLLVYAVYWSALLFPKQLFRRHA